MRYIDVTNMAYTLSPEDDGVFLLSFNNRRSYGHSRNLDVFFFIVIDNVYLCGYGDIFDTIKQGHS